PFRSVSPRRISTPPHLAYLRIADGCDNRCAYCLIPKLRGPYQERPRNLLLAEARQMVEGGVKEIILIAQETTYYGRGGKGAGELPSLLRDLNDIPGLEWIRIMYTHPARVNRQILQTISECDKVCPYLDIPLQHINDTILDLMRRNISRSRIEKVLRQARELVPGISIRTTMMVGFPGEEEKEFSQLCDFVINQRFDNLGVFAYSPETGTAAIEYGPGVGPDESERRRDILMEIQQGISAERLKGFRDKTIDILVDGPYPEAGSDLMVGRGVFQAPEIDGVVVVEGENLRPGQMVKVKIIDSSEYDLYGISIN
ncbi:MAG: MiaB/RimO family radical SAM methylthiotransferase, partial [Candidatus Auribacterota bacterium]|nr:MiaB/RimO family radical SAM methylthiotransferase [Candidatus Auribacterota bacterium]